MDCHCGEARSVARQRSNLKQSLKIKFYILFNPHSLEALKGDRIGQYSIRINDQWRICFSWDNGAQEVEIVDYH